MIVLAINPSSPCTGYAVMESSGKSRRVAITPEKFCRVEPVSNTLWTRSASKARRQARVKALHPSYNPSSDKGGDVADAVSLGLWWSSNKQSKGSKNEYYHKETTSESEQ